MQYKLSHLVDVTKVQTLTDLLHKATGISVSVIDPDGEIVAESGWQDVCRQFHGVSPETRRWCRRSTGTVAMQFPAGEECAVEKCRNGLVDAGTPIKVLGQHVGDLVAGQFLLQPPDLEFFRRQAARAGFDESAYMQAVSRVPVIDEARLRTFLRSFTILTEILGEAGARKFIVEMGQSKPAKKGVDAGSHTIEDVNAALRGIRKQREEDRSGLEENIFLNVKELILPYVDRLKKSPLDPEQASTVDTLETNLRKITSPVIRKMQTLGLTAREIAVASLLKEGKTTKQIADFLGISPGAVEFHRYNMRKKLGIDHKKINLRSYLQSID